jgi:hypothetical protein
MRFALVETGSVRPQAPAESGLELILTTGERLLPHLPRAARADGGEYLVGAEFGSNGRGHRSERFYPQPRIKGRVSRVLEGRSRCPAFAHFTDHATRKLSLELGSLEPHSREVPSGDIAPAQRVLATRTSITDQASSRRTAFLFFCYRADKTSFLG